MLLYMYRVDKDVVEINTIYPYANARLAKRLEAQNLKDYLYSKSFTPTVRSIFTSNMRTIYGLELDQVNALFGLLMIKSGGGNVEAITYSDEGCAQEKKGSKPYNQFNIYKTLCMLIYLKKNLNRTK
jgi:hypothetical protein